MPEQTAHRISESLVPASASQRRLWFLDQLNPNDVSYNMLQAHRLRGPLDVESLRKCLNAVLERHEILRTTFSVHGDELVQVAGNHVPLDLPAVDLDLAGNDEIQAFVDDELRRPFDLQAGPLFRANLYRLGSDDHLLLTSQHHIIFDRTSVGLLHAEIRSLYDGFTAGQKDIRRQVDELVVQYADYAKWSAERSQSETLVRHVDFWRKRLDGLDPLELPTDRPRSRSTTTKGEHLFLDLTDQHVRDLAGLARDNEATLFMGLAAVFNLLLHQWTGARDIAVGTPFADRRLSGTEKLLGFFVNNLVLRTGIDPDATFVDLLRQMRKVCFGAYRHGAVPFEKLVESIRPKRQENRNPLFDVHFAYQKRQEKSLRLDGVDVEEIVPSRSTSQYDVMLTVREQDDGFDARIEYRTDLFDAETIHRLLRRFDNLLRVVSETPTQPLSKLPLMTASEHDEIAGWNATSVDYESSGCILQYIDDTMARSPDAIALECGESRISFGELDDRSRRLARFLNDNGVGPEVLVGLCVERSIDMIVALVGILRAGGAYVPLDPDYPAERLGFMIDDADAPIIIAQHRLLDRLPESQARIVCIDRDWPEIASRPVIDGGPSIDPASLAYVIFTSGSTGRPKGAMNEHRAVCNRLLWMQDTYRLSSDDAVLQKTPFSFDVSVWELFLPLMTGAKMVIPKPGGHHDPAYLANTIMERGVTFLHFVPSMLQVFLEQPGLHDKCRSVRAVVCSGEALTFELQEKFFENVDAELHNLYGPTEAAIDVTHWKCAPGSDWVSVPIGRPIANTQIHILDEYGRPVAPGVEGELHIGGVQVGRGYLNRDELTAEKFIRDPFSPDANARLYRSGDVARWRLDGAIEYRGRIDFQVKVRGLRIELGEIEVAIVDTGLVQQAVVTVREDRTGDQRIVAYFVPEQGQTAIGNSLRAKLGDRLPGYMIPQHFVELQTLPLTTSGKVDRKSLPAPDLGSVSGSENFVAPRSRIEKILAEIWRELLGVDRVGVRDNFIELGGHSLLALRAISRAKQELGVDIPAMSMIMDTLEQVAAPFDHEAPVADTGIGAAAASTSSPCYFGPGDELFGLYHEPPDAGAARGGVLICGPIYIESITANWAIKRLAGQLANMGFHVFRFDYYGSGDSMGDSVDGNVTRWLQDVEAASQELRARAGLESISIVGLRVGATLAAMSALDAVDHIVLWDPIIDGLEYMTDLRERHRAMIEDCNENRRRPVREGEFEILGFSCSPQSRAEIEAIRIPELYRSTAKRIDFVIADQGREYGGLAQEFDALGHSIDVHFVDDASCEVKQHARLTAYMPNRALQAICSILRKDDQ